MDANAMDATVRQVALRLAGVLAVGALTFHSAVADEGVSATWAATSSGVNSWVDVASWTGASRVPTNIADDVSFTSASAAKTVKLPALQNKYHGLGTSYLMGLDSVSGIADYTIDLGAHTSSYSGSASSQYDRFLRVREVSDFYGTWRSQTAGWPGAAAFAGLALVPNAGDVPTVRNVDLSRGFRVWVESPASSARVDALKTGGRLEANYGANIATGGSITKGGNIEIMRPAGSRTDLLFGHGNLTLNGADRSLPAELVAGALAHFDASAAASLETVRQDDVIYVTKWNDISGHGLAATPIDDAHCPTLSPLASNGLPAVDFGSYSASGQTGKMNWSEVCSGVREVYLVFQDVEPGNARAQLLANTTVNSPFIRPEAKSSGIFSSDFVDPVAQGEIRLDGGRVSASENENLSAGWHVLSVRLTSQTTVNAFAHLGDGTCSGGVRIGEVIVYGAALSDAQRMANERYLAEKWTPDKSELWDYGLVRLSNTNGLNVATGTLAVRSLEVESGATEFVKSGAGDLRVERLNPTITTVRVKEGGFAFAGSTAVDDSEVKDTPALWFDANTVDGSAGAEVSSWNDCRGANYGRAVPSVFYSEYLKANYTSPNATVAAGPNGNKVVDFGEWCQAGAAGSDGWGGSAHPTSAAFTFNNNYGAIREAFLVVAFNANHDSAIFWSSSTQLEPSIAKTAGAYGNLFDLQGADPAGQASAVWIDGRQVDPRVQSKSIFANGSYHVVNIRLVQRTSMPYIASSRGIGNANGGVLVGEVVYYDHFLSDGDRRDTCAHLMKKWLGAAHPDKGAQANVTRIIYEQPSQKTVLHVSEDATLSSVSIPNTGSFVKTGAGALTVSKLAPEARSLAVTEGSFDATLDLFAGAFFHVDATDGDSITENADGKVTKWSDTDGGSVYASQYKPYGLSDLIALPTVKKVDLNGSGTERNVVDFGSYFKEVGTYWPAREGKNSAAMSWSAKPEIREVHVVKADRDWDKSGSGYCYPPVLGFSAVGATGLTDCYPFYRLDQELFQNASWGGKSFSRGIADGEIYMDGVAKDYTFKPETDRFYVMSFVPSNALVNVNVFAGNAQGQIGGQQIGETVVFTQTNTLARRTAIMRHLARKWTQPDAEGQVWNMMFDSLSASNGGTLTLRTNAESQTTTTADLSFGFAADGSCAKIVIDGVFDLPAAGTLTVSVPAGFKPRGQRYELLSANELKGVANLENWTIILPENCRDRYQVKADPTGLSLVRINNGLIMMMR